MSDTQPNHGGFGPPSQPPQQPAPGYGYPQQSGPGYGYPQGQPGYPAAPPVYPQTPGYGMPAQPSNGMGTTGLVLGIIGVVCSLTFIFWFFGVILGILGIIFGAIGRGKATRGEATNKGAATAGLVCGIVATVVLPLLGLLVFASFMSSSSTF
ncbi:DUF4190 domain-containing protein [Streptomyces naganishii]|uniref:DUF4190 domain-containing protein n=1 Tax=Streptomyces naganishii JCM 4654 TaxID=1306179 RepID=A0A919CYK0_9ACTN|nr:DUF4190 domain-containing protein [Streptomyces naganishii]GHD95144.1 hypothetical protein GCM10010508_58640 [Streptomyces naganishii JCM 4654]